MIRKNLLIWVTIIASLLFIFRLAYLQLSNDFYKSASNNNAIQELAVYPERGLIFDRNGKLIVSNQPMYELVLIPENLSEFDTLELTEILGMNKDNLINKITDAFNYSTKIPSIIKSQITREQNALIQEKIWKYNGFYLVKKSTRDYIYPIASNIIGYIGEVSPTEIERDKYYKKGENIGKQGIEKFYENDLRGAKGKKFLQKNRFNKIIGPFNNSKNDIPAKVSNNLTLTIDAELQKYAEELMKNKKGGIVVIEPQTGEVLSLVSAPTYKLSKLLGNNRSENYNTLLRDTINQPLFDRSLQAQYSPGSPLKVLNALIGLQEKVIDNNTSFRCDGGHYYARNAFMRCHNTPGTISDLKTGIYNSCNTYFAKTYKRIIEKYESPAEGIDSWSNHLKSFGLGDYLGYDLPIGKTGFIPESGYYDRLYGENRWGASTIISNSIGQGEVLTTPIQMANIVSAIANRGFYIQPHFVKKIENNQVKSFEKRYTSINKENFDIVIDGMFDVVEKGTARIAKVNNLKIAGKTGTIENFTIINNERKQLTDHSTFIAFAPVENPKIAISVFIENGYWGSRWAAPIASLIIEKYINGEVSRSWLERRMLDGSLLEEYEKPYKFDLFEIKE
ncbi:MAG TPA: penicillin-binding protein 2 [Flavobacteriaceae bacterium]|nr:penicillin-binding protein 2 [Flavobacteriaceae bacterium]